MSCNISQIENMAAEIDRGKSKDVRPFLWLRFLLSE